MHTSKTYDRFPHVKKMTIWQFDENMIGMLKGIVGKRFLSVETDDSMEGQSYCVARLNFGGTSILLKNEEEIAMFENEDVPYEEAAKFSCSISDTAHPFMPGLVGAGIKKFDVCELVESVDIVADKITCVEQGIDIIMDIAVIVSTQNHAYIFSKSHVWFDEVIYENVDKSIDEICSLLSDLSLWNNDGQLSVSIERSVRKI